MIFLIDDDNSKKYGIYKIINLKTGKVYIGQTKENFKRRFWFHRWKLRQGSHDNNYLQKSWNKYGEENFAFDIVEILNHTNINDINQKEIYWISYYSELTGVYNIQNGGQPERLVKYVSPESRKKVGALNRKRMLGTKLSVETKRKMSEARTGKRVYRENDSLTDDQVISIKQMYINGCTSREIMDALNVQYRSLNNILSCNAYRTVNVDGWDEFLVKHEIEIKERKEKTKLLHEKIVSMFNDGYSRREIADCCKVDRNTVKYHLKKEKLI